MEPHVIGPRQVGPPGIAIVMLTEPAQHLEAATLLAQIWGAPVPYGEVPPPLLTAIAHCGGYVAGGYDGGQLVVAGVGIRGDGHLHSHIAGVQPRLRQSGLGHKLKLHQRDWADANGMPEVRWTFDPLIRRNAAFNLHKVGATVIGYRAEFYGQMDDRVNAGDATDRLLVRWRIDAPPAPPPLDRVPDLAHTVLDQFRHSELKYENDILAVAVPFDIEGLRRHHPNEATQWRFAVREALTGALDAGYAITGITRDGSYLLERV